VNLFTAEDLAVEGFLEDLPDLPGGHTLRGLAAFTTRPMLCHQGALPCLSGTNLHSAGTWPGKTVTTTATFRQELRSPGGRLPCSAHGAHERR
jgi:hypothetical protein